MLLPFALCALFLAIDINSQPVAASEVIRNYTGSRSGLPGVIKALCWLAAAGFSMAGARSLYNTVMRTWDEPILPDPQKRAWVYFFLGICFTLAPSMHAAFFSPLCNAAYGLHTEASSGCAAGAGQSEYHRRHISLILAYGGALGFYLSHFALSKALRFRNTPAEAVLNREAASLLLISFVVTSIPFVWALMMGVELR